MSQALEIPLQSQAQIEAGARSKVYALLAEALAFPDKRLFARLSSRDWPAELEEAVALLPFRFSPETAAEAIPGDAADRRTLERHYIALFEVGPGGPFCALYEGAHRGGRMKIMEELVRFFEHFGLKSLSGDHPDHLCAELQFMHFLAFKEAAAAGAESRGALRAAQRDFLYRHLCKWLPRVVARLRGARRPSPVYPALAGLASDFCAADLAWLKGVSGNL